MSDKIVFSLSEYKYYYLIKFYFIFTLYKKHSVLCKFTAASAGLLAIYKSFF